MTETVSRPAVLALAECPIGLFMCDETLALKTEYGNNDGRIDAYIVETGEFFWGHQPQTIENQRATLVRPVEWPLALPATDTAECERLRAAQNVVNEQAENEALWATPMFASEAFLQQQLRRLHAAIEGKTPDECGMTALKDQGNG